MALLFFFLPWLSLPLGALKGAVPDELSIDDLDCVVPLPVLYRRLREQLGHEDVVQVLARVVRVGGRAECESRVSLSRVIEASQS